MASFQTVVEQARKTLGTLRTDLVQTLQQADAELMVGENVPAEQKQAQMDRIVKKIAEGLDKLRQDVVLVQKEEEAQRNTVNNIDAEAKRTQKWNVLENKKRSLEKEVHNKNVTVKLLIDRLRTLRQDLWLLTAPGENRAPRTLMQPQPGGPNPAMKQPQ
mmetsp:Transcript_5372/g.16030  ORF Transcript_5372/g.16030 Transcript_5372/m.16030 type:complete len:160 (-) Transcript_5372:485-964(-)|eukprot:CAMPEP_0198723422 /NCGR_PEP_ID=MMETSP1475-20131203/923_1 /TAXON_ID= ORGANISM="Unidentified sp., Strain CCMP1999" /NCGR_SAMPLE_ID=MMETSP1475 /ASSEMBLY_ACC=CAM_ASM_001111 /LENGTH=159 /DNA_ID=CAMNT_0044484539 /DNA_START=58 /DNA_END=537 /DNA_ORIENTATION=+